MKAKFLRTGEGELGIEFAPESTDEQLLLEEYTRNSHAFTFRFHGWEHNKPGRDVYPGLTAVRGTIEKVTADALSVADQHYTTLLAAATKYRAALIEALDIADYEAAEVRGRPEHLTRLAELRKLVTS